MMLSSSSSLLVEAIMHNNEAVRVLTTNGDLIGCSERLHKAFHAVKESLELYRAIRSLPKPSSSSVADHHASCDDDADGDTPRSAVLSAAPVQEEQGGMHHLRDDDTAGRPMVAQPSASLLLSSSLFQEEILPARGDLFTFRRPLCFAPKLLDQLRTAGQLDDLPLMCCTIYVVSAVALFNMGQLIHHQRSSSSSSLVKAHKLYHSVIQLVSESPKPEALRPLFIDLSILAWNNVLQVSVELGDYGEATRALSFLQQFCRMWRALQGPLPSVPVERRRRLLDQETFVDIASTSIVIQQQLLSPSRSGLNDPGPPGEDAAVDSNSIIPSTSSSSSKKRRRVMGGFTTWGCAPAA